ncbi:alpha/beta hydrolase [Streptomyces xinghaiensis]|uniref:alpha/beta fold hydrolase n=1 Tax=Streptomyces xinghaiensis TaxID=1038928 RepID=UPI002E12E7DD|nr:alpha/beta hydrolase [Streptomyces xinghaiensis]
MPLLPPSSGTRRTARSRLRRASGAVALVAAALLGSVVPSHAGTPGGGDGGAGGTDSRPGHRDRPTVVLVHGAFSDGSAWRGVIKRLRHRGYPVIAPANPLRDLAGDSAYIASVLRNIEGPVVLVGHSYAGAVISNAAAGDPDVKALVYIAAFALDVGESTETISEAFPGGEVSEAVVPVPYTRPDGGTGTEFYVRRDRYREVLMADVPRHEAALMAVHQRPIGLAAVTGVSQAAAWRTIPSWFLVAREDRALSPAAERFMARRAGARTVEIDAPHFAQVSHPGPVARLITDAAEHTAHTARLPERGDGGDGSDGGDRGDGGVSGGGGDRGGVARTPVA